MNTTRFNNDSDISFVAVVVVVVGAVSPLLP